jgi:predicted transglutaminase-like cysteine proteinase
MPIKNKSIKSQFNSASKNAVEKICVLFVSLGFMTMTGCRSVQLDKENWIDAQTREAQAIKNPDSHSQFNEWLKTFDHYKNSTLEDKVLSVDRIIDHFITYTTDNQQYGRPDYWASPFETFATRKGDCDDFAILKYYVLTKYLDVSQQECFFAVGSVKEQGHAFLLINLGSPKEPKWYVADNDGTGILREVKDLISWKIEFAFNDSQLKEFDDKAAKAVFKTASPH